MAAKKLVLGAQGFKFSPNAQRLWRETFISAPTMSVNIEDDSRLLMADIDFFLTDPSKTNRISFGVGLSD